jgi:uncharacterized protein YbjT (DUF2867 family)
MKSPILIGGAAGATGSAATKLLLERGFSVRAFVHKEDERSQKLQSLGAEIFVGDVLDLRAIRRAFDGVKRVYFVYPMRPGLVEATANYAQAAVEVKAECIVNMSQRTSRPDALSNSALNHWLAERIFDWAPTPVTHLRPTAFNEWVFYVRQGIIEGRYPVPFGPTGRFAPIAVEDQARVIAAGEQWVQEVAKSKIPFLVQHMEGIAEMHRNGLMGGTNDAVEKITGRRPLTVAEFIEKHRAAFQ